MVTFKSAPEFSPSFSTDGDSLQPPSERRLAANDTFRPLLLLLFFLVMSVSSTHARPQGKNLNLGSKLPNLASLYDVVAPKLISGGAFVYIVPFPTVGDADAQNPDVWRDCTDKALVSAEGLEQARRVNRALKSLPVTISYAQTGDSCLAMSSLGYLLSGIATVVVTTSDFDPYGILRTRAKDPVLASQIQAQFTNGRPDETKLMVGSRMASQVAPHPVLADLSPGESAIFIESGTDYPTLLARLTPQQWAEMANYWHNRVSIAGKRVSSARRK
jgi:hypothetical protein